MDSIFFYLLIFLLPTQFGKHFWFDFSYVLGQRIDYLSPTLYITDILLIFLFIITVLKKRISFHPFFSLLVLVLSVGISLSYSPMVGWYMLLKFLELSFLVWYAVHSKAKPVILGTLFAGSAIFESILSIVQTIHQGSLGGLFYFLGERAFSGTTPGIANASVGGQLILRPYGTFSHPNMLAGYLVVAMLLIPYFLSRKTSFQRILIIVSLVCGTMSLALTLGRVAIVSWVLVGAIILVVTFRERIEKFVLSAALGVLTTLLLASVFFQPFLQRALTFSLDQSFQERSLLAINAFAMIFARPFFGVGLGNFIPSLPFFAKNGLILQPVHNIYLLIAAETGIGGLILFLCFLATMMRRLFHVWRTSPVKEKNKILLLLLCLFVILFTGFFDHYFLTLQQGQLLFALVIGLIIRKIQTSATIQE